MAAIRVERELAHDEDLTANVCERKIHPLFRIFKNAQPRHFVGECRQVRFRIVRRDAEKDQDPRSDLSDQFTGDAHAGG